jgi:hypothetical protein
MVRADEKSPRMPRDFRRVKIAVGRVGKNAPQEFAGEMRREFAMGRMLPLFSPLSGALAAL